MKPKITDHSDYLNKHDIFIPLCDHQKEHFMSLKSNDEIERVASSINNVNLDASKFQV